MINAFADQKLEDIFWRASTGRLGGEGLETEMEKRAKAIPAFITEEDSKSFDEIVNPIDRRASTEEKLRQMAELREEARPVFNAFIERVKAEVGIESNDNDKTLSKAEEKAKRDTIRQEHPEFDVEHLRDFYRGKAILTDPRQIVQIAKIIQESGLGVIKFDWKKLLNPKIWGFRVMSFDLRMPNGLMVEYYTPLQEIESVKDECHEIYEKWRDKTAEYKNAHRQEYRQDVKKSNEIYSKAWNAALSRLGISQEELSRSLIRALRSAGLVTISNDSADTAGAKQPGDQVPSSDLLKNESSKSSALFESGSAAISKSSKTISTSIENTEQVKHNTDKRQVISDENNTRNKPLPSADTERVQGIMVKALEKTGGEVNMDTSAASDSKYISVTFYDDENQTVVRFIPIGSEPPFPILIGAGFDIWISRKSKTARDVLHLVSPQPISGKGACFWHFSLDRWGAKNSLGKSKQNFGPVTQR
ncbi:MAG: hypothetical protein QM218_01180 [Candidatus Cloacimonadota bacterium]|nr:hypothetical protein [Candidatus Cloacimonadota bacterium]